MPNQHTPIGRTEENLQNRYGETNASLRKIENASYNVVSTYGVSLENCCGNPGLKNELRSHSYLKNSPINIREALYGFRTKATKIHYRLEEWEKKHYMDVISLYPHTCIYNFPSGHRN